MAQSGYTPIQLYYSTTASAVPTSGNLLSGELAINITDGKLYFKNNGGTVTLLASSGGASGDVVGPASATDNAVVRFDGTTGKLVQNSGVLIADDGTTVISVNSATDALRITQTGAGNALVVEDSANPDATPFVVDASGTVIAGATAAYSTSGIITPVLNATTLTAGGGIGLNSWVGASSGAANVQFMKSRGATAGSYTIVNDSDTLGILRFSGSDGVQFISAATITAAVDGTPGTNDMPGRLVFATTADGASSPTERMRIDSAGNVGIGGTTVAGINLRLAKAITGATTAMGTRAINTIQSDVTSSAYIFDSVPTTEATAFTLATLAHYRASPTAFGAGSAVTTQVGFLAESTLTEATNNYGFYSNIASGTGRWNFHAAGTAANYFGGNTIINGAVGIGTAGSPSYGTSGQVLTSQGSGSPPVWAAASSSTSIGLVRAIAINCILP